MAMRRVLACLAAVYMWVGTRDTQAYPGPYPPGGSCNVNGPQTICLAAPFGSNAVLQRAPASAAITGSVPLGYGASSMGVTVALVDEDGAGFGATVSTQVRPDRTWKVLLPPRPTFGNYTLTAQCTSGCQGANATSRCVSTAASLAASLAAWQSLRTAQQTHVPAPQAGRSPLGACRWCWGVFRVLSPGAPC